MKGSSYNELSEGIDCYNFALTSATGISVVPNPGVEDCEITSEHSKCVKMLSSWLCSHPCFHLIIKQPRIPS